MAKQLITVTDTWQQVAAGAAVFTVHTVGKGVLKFDEAQDDATAYSASPAVGEQFEQGTSVATFVRATGDGWKIVADGVL